MYPAPVITNEGELQRYNNCDTVDVNDLDRPETRNTIPAPTHHLVQHTECDFNATSVCDIVNIDDRKNLAALTAID